MKNNYRTSIATLFFIASFLSCSKKDIQESTVCDGTPRNFVADVNPLIQTYCNQGGCHDATSLNGPGALTNYAEVFSARVDIKGQVEAGLMPQNTVLTTAQK